MDREYATCTFRGLSDQKLDGHGAYKYDYGGAYFYRLSIEDPDRAVQNPDHLSELSGK